MKWISIISLVVLAVGCSSTREKPTLERGWVGGEFGVAKNKRAITKPQGTVYVKQVYPETPAARAGLQPGDAILNFNGEPVRTVSSFRRLMDRTIPGAPATIRVSRAGEPLDLLVTMGRETYQRWHGLQVGLHLSTEFDLWPNPDFSLDPVAHFKRPAERVELRSPETILRQQATPERPQGERGVRSEEGWKAWFLILGLEAHKRILSQELVPSRTAKR